MRFPTLLTATAMLLIMAGSANAFFVFPDCGDPGVVEKVKNRFNSSERYGALAHIESIEFLSERAIENFGPSPIFRRYCQGRAHLADGRQRTVHYLIEDNMGLAGFGWNVEFCLDGHDPWRVYDGGCRVLRR